MAVKDSSPHRSVTIEDDDGPVVELVLVGGQIEIHLKRIALKHRVSLEDLTEAVSKLNAS